MKTKLHIIFLFFILNFILFGCIENREYPIEPKITYKSFASMQDASGKDSLGFLTIEFTDGDGDIGLSQADTFPPYNIGSEFYYNFFITFFEKKDGKFVKIEQPYNSRIPDVNPEKIDKDLAGDITIEIDLKILSLVITQKTIKMSAFMYDRALNKSNEIETPEININL
ncbi:MAG: hypothetical protein GX259_00515 [Bacteroidales bacterium]|nr:hypothetical protein [Bacteroidales bacterium]